MYSDSAEIKPAQCCIKLVFHLTYTMMHGSTKLKIQNYCFSKTEKLIESHYNWTKAEKVTGQTELHKEKLHTRHLFTSY